MDQHAFDQLARAVARPGPSRRGLLRGTLAAGAAALVGARARAARAEQAKQTLCHRTGDPANPFVAITVAEPAWDTHFGHGDSAYVDCGVDADCTVPGETCGGGGVPCACGAPCAAEGADCLENGDCCSGVCQIGTCVATIAGTCQAGDDYCVDRVSLCGNTVCRCFPTLDGGSICAAGGGGCEACGPDAPCGDGKVCITSTCCASGTSCAEPCPSDPNTCFVAGTRIAMADGTSRPIEAVAVGDAVLGRAGRANQVVAVARPLLGNRPLYGLNGGAPFVTAGHPFLADGAWKAIDPVATEVENPALPVGRLAVGDRLLTLAGVLVPAGLGGWADVEPVDLRLEPVPLASIVGRPAGPATPLYNLQLDGDHTYFANDWLVHNK